MGSDDEPKKYAAFNVGGGGQVFSDTSVFAGFPVLARVDGAGSKAAFERASISTGTVGEVTNGGQVVLVNSFARYLPPEAVEEVVAEGNKGGAKAAIKKLAGYALDPSKVNALTELIQKT